MDEQSVLYPFEGILFNHKRNEALTLATMWMILEKLLPSERNQTKRTTYGMISCL